MNIDDDYDNDGNNIVPCPICLDVYCPSKEDGKCPQEDEFAKHYLNTPDTEWEKEAKEVIIATYPEDIFPEPEYKPKNNEVAWVMREMTGAVVSILKPIVEDIITSRDTYWQNHEQDMYESLEKANREQTILDVARVRDERDTYWKERVRKEVEDALRRLDIDDHNYLTARREIAKVSGIPMMAITFNEHLKVIKEKLEATPITNNR